MKRRTYFIGSGPDGPIKIGKSRDIRGRMFALQTGNPERLILLAETDAHKEHLKPDCHTCPHRRLPLNGLPVKDGAVICPGHGLQWNLTTGDLVRRVSI